jgi:hypothetical protein
MQKIDVDWLGRCAKQRLRVNLSPQQIRDRLQKSLVKDETVADALFSFVRRYTGTIRDDRFTIWPCKRHRRPQPELTGTIKQVDGGSVIEFEIATESMFSAWLILMPVVGALALLLPLVYFWMELPAPLYFSPCIIPILVGLTVVGGFGVRREAVELLRFFLDQIGADAIA